MQNSKVVFYTTGCPRCRVLKSKLDKAGVDYDTNSDVEKMVASGLSSAPALSIDGKLLGFADACRWADSQKEKNGHTA